MMRVVHTTIGHLINFSITGRPLDICEMVLGRNQPFLDVPLSDISESLSLLDEEGKLYAIGGIQGHTVWMLCTTEVETHKIKFLKGSKELLNEVLKVTGYLENYVWMHNTLHIRWLKWLGAEFGEVKGDFQYFKLERKGE